MKLELFLYKLERKISKISIQRLMSLVSGAMLLIYLFDLIVGNISENEVSLYNLLAFDLGAIFKGQVWRIITFVFLYPLSSGFTPIGTVLITLIGIYFYWWVGTALESRMGTPRFNLYYFIGIFGSIISALVFGLITWIILGTPISYLTNEYLNLSLFLAFATMFPDVQVLVMYIIPVKVKWLGIIDGVLLLYLFVIGTPFDRVAIVAAMLNYLLFFGPHLIRLIKRKNQERKWKKGGFQEGVTSYFL